MHLTALHKLLFTLAFTVLAMPAFAQQPPRTIHWADVELLDGRVMKAGELTGKTVVVEFWASWCPFCMKQNPHFEKLHRAHQGKGLVVLTFTIDRTDEAARQYMKKHGYTFPVARSTPEIEAWFGGRRTLPEVYVVDSAGRVVFREAGEMFEEDILALGRFARK
jgi:thiol-disulfide isomerase/thioredoxin